MNFLAILPQHLQLMQKEFSALQNVCSCKKLNMECIKVHLKSLTEIKVDDTAFTQIHRPLTVGLQAGCLMYHVALLRDRCAYS